MMIFAICVMDVLSIIKLNDTQLYIIIILDKYNVQRTHFSTRLNHSIVDQFSSRH